LSFKRFGAGKPLVLIHGLGASHRSWAPVSRQLAQHRELFVPDLPGHGASPAASVSSTFDGQVDAVAAHLHENGLEGADLVGSSMGARIVLELARRGHRGSVVALDPGGFWKGWERRFFEITIGASVRLVRALQPVLPALARSSLGRTALLAQLSARPWRLDPGFVLGELQSIAQTPVFDALTRDLARGPGQQGAVSTPGRVTIAWGRQDRLCLPRQAARAAARFPGATIHWFDRCGHFPMWDQPQASVDLILDATR
jgi:pimeloyl-ACP methyl ester carboxylesterase